MLQCRFKSILQTAQSNSHILLFRLQAALQCLIIDCHHSDKSIMLCAVREVANAAVGIRERSQLNCLAVAFVGGG